MYHVVRLASQAEQILTEGDLDLQEKSRREHMKAIRRGESSLEDGAKWFGEKEKTLESLYRDSTLRHQPDREKIRQLLIDCLEHHYGSIQQAYQADKYEKFYNDVVALTR